MRINMIEIFVDLPTSIDVADLAVKSVEVNHTPINFGLCQLQKMGERIKIVGRYCSQDIDLDSSTLSNLEIVHGQELIKLEDVSQALLYGEDLQGYAVVSKVTIPQGASYIKEHDIHVRHLVVSGVHGNFKNPDKAKLRASKYKDARVIQIHA